MPRIDLCTPPPLCDNCCRTHGPISHWKRGRTPMALLSAALGQKQFAQPGMQHSRIDVLTPCVCVWTNSQAARYHELLGVPRFALAERHCSQLSPTVGHYVRKRVPTPAMLTTHTNGPCSRSDKWAITSWFKAARPFGLRFTEAECKCRSNMCV